MKTLQNVRLDTAGSAAFCNLTASPTPTPMHIYTRMSIISDVAGLEVLQDFPTQFSSPWSFQDYFLQLKMASLL